MEWLQKIYICILNPFCGISQKINDTTRKRLIYTVVLLLYSTCHAMKLLHKKCSSTLSRRAFFTF